MDPGIVYSLLCQGPRAEDIKNVRDHSIRVILHFIWPSISPTQIIVHTGEQAIAL